MRIIPVIDIRNGVSVHAIKSHREKYAPLRSGFSESSDPVEIASKLMNNMGFDELYVADIDGILSDNPDLQTLSRLCSIKGLKVMIDAGVNTIAKAAALRQIGVRNMIIGTETLETIEQLDEILLKSKDIEVTISLDLKEGSVISKCHEIRNNDPLNAMRRLEKNEVKQMIVLDLSRVGSEQGIDLELAKKITTKTKLPIIFGGGISSLEEIRVLGEAGVSGVLIATLLYSGKPGLEELNSIRKPMSQSYELSGCFQ
ncbi:MAG TPA: HisA/HisF-related TIM barrel protein [Nitrososphaerales archaeon]